MEIASYWRNYIDGAWADGGAGRLPVENPATGEPLAEQALAVYRTKGRAYRRLSDEIARWLGTAAGSKN